MSSPKSLIEIKESLKSLIDPKYMFFDPSHIWMVEIFNDDGVVIRRNKTTTLYCIIGQIYYYYFYTYEESNEFPKHLDFLFEECVSTGFSDLQYDDSFVKSFRESGASYYAISYQGKPRFNEDHIQNCSVTAQSLALESISIIAEFARRDEVDELYEIKEYLSCK